MRACYAKPTHQHHHTNTTFNPPNNNNKKKKMLYISTSQRKEKNLKTNLPLEFPYHLSGFHAIITKISFLDFLSFSHIVKEKKCEQ